MSKPPFMIDAETQEGQAEQVRRLLLILNAPLGLEEPPRWRWMAHRRWSNDQTILLRAKMAAMTAAIQYAFRNIVIQQNALGETFSRVEEIKNGFHLLHGQVQALQVKSGEPSVVIN